MRARETGTEQLIKDTAKKVFFAEGRMRATTQDIADAAGISRTSLHYYFRSREELMRQVFNEAVQQLDEKMYQIMDAKIQFDDKIGKLVEAYLNEMLAYPHTEIYMVTEMASMKSKLFEMMEPGDSHMKAFLAEIESEMKAGRIKQMNPIHFVLNLFSLAAYPLIVSPLQRMVFSLNEEQYIKLMKERKQLIVDILLR